MESAGGAGGRDRKSERDRNGIAVPVSLLYVLLHDARYQEGVPSAAERDQSTLGPAATRALPASLVVYLAKFLMKREARSRAFSSHSLGSA